MLIVEIWVNHKLIGKETAVRIEGGTDPDDLNTYRFSDGCEMCHRYGDGAARLAEAMMKHLADEKGL